MESKGGDAIKDASDVRRALDEGDTAVELWEVYGERIAWLLAVVLDDVFARLEACESEPSRGIDT